MNSNQRDIRMFIKLDLNQPILVQRRIFYIERGLAYFLLKNYVNPFQEGGFPMNKLSKRVKGRPPIIKTTKEIFKLTEEQKRAINKIKAWEKESRERNITLGGSIEF